MLIILLPLNNRLGCWNPDNAYAEIVKVSVALLLLSPTMIDCALDRNETRFFKKGVALTDSPNESAIKYSPGSTSPSEFSSPSVTEPT